MSYDSDIARASRAIEQVNAVLGNPCSVCDAPSWIPCYDGLAAEAFHAQRLLSTFFAATAGQRD